MVGSEEESDGDAVSAHSPEPWTYDEDAYEIRDARGYVAVEFRPGAPRTHENGHRIAALSAENARLRDLLESVEDTLRTTQSRMSRKNLSTEEINMQIDRLYEARTALRAGGAEKGVGT